MSYCRKWWDMTLPSLVHVRSFSGGSSSGVGIWSLRTSLTQMAYVRVTEIHGRCELPCILDERVSNCLSALNAVQTHWHKFSGLGAFQRGQLSLEFLVICCSGHRAEV